MNPLTFYYYPTVINIFSSLLIISLNHNNGILKVVDSKQLSRCDLAIELKALLPPEDFKMWLGDWICMAEAGSKLNTDLKTPGTDPNFEYGIFQIGNQYWCQDSLSHRNPMFRNNCQMNCTELLDDDVKNDIDCALKLLRDHPNFTAWWSWKNQCEGQNLDKYRYLVSCEATEPPVPPYIISTSNTTLIFRNGSLNQNIDCSASGTPTPEVKWEFDIKFLPELRSHIFPNKSMVRLSFPQVDAQRHEGFYTCIATNTFGEAKQAYQVHVKQSPPTPPPDMNPSNPNFPYGIAIGIPFGILAIAIIAVVIYFRRLIIKVNGLTKEEIHKFINGTPSSGRKDEEDVDSNIMAHEIIQHQPYDTNYEIPANQLVQQNAKILGSGQYGYVTKAEYNGNPVAVKAVKPNTDKLYIQALLSELKIMIHLGKGNENIVQLVGAVTAGLNKGILLIVVEYCPNGDLQNYLRHHKDNFKELEEPPYENDVSQMRNYENINPITTVDLINWCIQIANGMDFLGSRKVLHGDLAARNVLLSFNYVAKITDFGLSRQLVDYANYVKKHEAPLPWRHMAIESLKERSFSTQSDVWAFGVTMWEIFNLGDIPYGGRSWTPGFVNEIENGMRLTQPKHAPDFIYERMKACWSFWQHDRPLFKTLASQLLNGKT